MIEDDENDWIKDLMNKYAGMKVIQQMCIHTGVAHSIKIKYMDVSCL